MIQGITKPVLQGMIRVMEAQLKTAKAIDTGCRSCENGGYEFKCKLAGGQAIPPEHRSGCDSWTWDEIPFDQRAAAPAPQAQQTHTFYRVAQPKRVLQGDPFWDDDIPF